MSAAPSDEVDGRRLRRAQNRLAVIEALGELHREGNYEPSAAEIADRAGLSQRSLFRYFDDVDDLYRATIEHHIEEAAPLLEVTVPGGAPTADKARRLAEARVALFDLIAPAAKAARITGWRHEVMAAQIRRGRAFYRAQLAELFADELAAMPDDRSSAALAAADVIAGFESYDLLRHDQRMSKGRVAAIVEQALVDLLEAPR